MKSKVVLVVVLISAVALSIFFASCISIYSDSSGLLISGYVIENEGNYYLRYILGDDELVVGSNDKHSVNFGTYCEVDTEIIDAFLLDVKDAREKCKIAHPEYEGYEKNVGDGETLYVLPQSGKISQYMNEVIDFENSIFYENRENGKQYTDMGGFNINVCEVPETNGKIVYCPSSNCDEVVFYLLASEINDDIKTMSYEEFYEKCNEIINPPKLEFRFPW